MNHCHAALHSSCPHALQNLASASFSVSHEPQARRRLRTAAAASRPLGSGWRICSRRHPRFPGRRSQCTGAETLRQVAFDLFAISDAGIELPHQPRRAHAEAARHLLPVAVGHLAHRAIELELLDGAQRQHLLALERDARALAEHRRAILFGRHQRAQRSQGGHADQRGGAHQQRQQHDGGHALSAAGKQRRRRAAERGEHEKLPRLERRRRPACGERRRVSAFGRTVSVEISELIVEAFLDRRVLRLGRPAARRFGMPRPPSRGHADDHQADRADAIRERATPGD